MLECEIKAFPEKSSFLMDLVSPTDNLNSAGKKYNVIYDEIWLMVLLVMACHVVEKLERTH